LRCYHRFWAPENFTADKRRKEAYAAVAIVLLVFLAVKILFGSENGQPNSPSQEKIGGSSDTNPGNAEGLDTVAVTTSTMTEASAVAADGFNEENSSIPNRADEAVFEEQRDAVLDSGFTQPQRQPQTELVLSKQELAQRLEAAKVRAERAKRISEQKQLAIANTVNSSDTEALSLLKVRLAQRIEQWRKAWQSGDGDAYLSFYSSEFQPAQGTSQQQWRAERRSRVVPDKNIVLEFSQFDVEFSDDNTRSVTEFNQRYVSNNYLEESRKELVLQMENRQWFIVSERNL